MRRGGIPTAPKVAGKLHQRSVSPVPAGGASHQPSAPSNSAALRTRSNANSSSMSRTNSNFNSNNNKFGSNRTTPVPTKPKPAAASSSQHNNNNNNLRAGGGSTSRQGSFHRNHHVQLPPVDAAVIERMDKAVFVEQQMLTSAEECVPVLEEQLERAIEQRDVEVERVMLLHADRQAGNAQKVTAVSKEVDEANETMERLMNDENMIDEKITMTFHQMSALGEGASKNLEQRENHLKSTLELRRRVLDDEKEEEQKAHDEEKSVGSNTFGLSAEGASYVKAEVEARKNAAHLTQESLNIEMKRRELFSLYQELKGTIRVYCRVKGVQNAEELDAVNRFLVFPDAQQQSGAGGKQLEVTSTRDNATSTGRRDTQTAFAYDQVFGVSSTQAQIFEEVGPLVDCAVDGYKVCIFAYGQTGGGKTYTMEGNDENPGLIPRAIDRVFERAASLHEDGWKYEVKSSFLEIYNESIRNLLEKDPGYHRAFFETTGGKPSTNRVVHEIVHHGKSDTTVSGIHEVVVKSPAQVHKLLATAGANRSIAQTKLNDRSSRSHCVFTMRIEGHSEKIHTRTMGILCLVDLAGSERVNESGATGQQLKEAIAINRSLMHLGECINSMGTNAVVSWRNCRLTYMLQNFLSGDGAKMLMFVAVSNKEEHVPETLNSLRFASKVNMTQIGQAKKRIA